MDAKTTLLSAFLFSSVFAKPVQTPIQDFRNTLRPLTVAMDKSTPAYAALEDCQYDYLVAENILENAEGYPQLEPEVLMVGPSNRILSSGQEKIQLKGQTITVDPKKDYLADLIKEQNDKKEPATYQQVAKVLVREELERRAALVDRESNYSRSSVSKSIPTANGGEIKVSKPVHIVNNTNPGTTESGNLIVKNSPRKGESSGSSLPTPSGRKPANIPTKDNSDNLLGASHAPKENVTIKGTITFLEGAALMGRRDQLLISQVVDGFVVSKGTINLNEASYAISVEKLEGVIETQVRSAEGHLTAIGRTNLYDLALRKPSRAQLHKVALAVRPVNSGISASVISAASYGDKTYPLQNAKLFVADINRQIVRNKSTDRFEDSSILIPSEFVVRSQHAKFWPTLAVAESGDEIQLKMFPDSLVNALLELTLDKFTSREALLKGVIWGKVAYEGQPISGARVRLLSDLDKRAIYFNGFLPDPTQNHTLASGDYAFSNIESGEKLIQVQLGSKVFWPTMIPVESKSVSHADLVIQNERTIQIESFDAFDQTPLRAVLQPLGTDHQILVPDSGQLQNQVQTVRGHTYIESDPGEPYVVTRALLSSDQTELYFPQIKGEWLAGFRGDKKPYVSQPSTQVVGFVYGDNYEVIVGNGNSANIKVVYFDSRGQEVKGHGVAGGGYVIYDLFPGRQSVTIIPDKSKNIITKSVYVDHAATTVTRVSIQF